MMDIEAVQLLRLHDAFREDMFHHAREALAKQGEVPIDFVAAPPLVQRFWLYIQTQAI